MDNNNLDLVVAGIFDSLPEQTRKVVLHIQLLVPYPKDATKSGLARKLYKLYPDHYKDERKAEKVVAQVWDAVKHQGISLNGRVLPLIRRDGSRYSGNLRYIVRQFHPGLEKQQIIEWERGFFQGRV